MLPEHGVSGEAQRIESLIARIYDTRTVQGASGIARNLHSAVDPAEGQFLRTLVSEDPSIRLTLEIGCAFGLSTLHLCLGLVGRPGARHTAIDPFQRTEWDAVGLTHVEAAGIDGFELIEERSEFALPRLVAEGEARFDLVFIDGWHTFDHTLVDAFYATRLLRVGGILVIDDVSFPAVRKVVKFLQKYPCYVLESSVTYEVASPRPTWRGKIKRMVAPLISQPAAEELPWNLNMVALRKTANDERAWNWHADF